MSLYDYLMDTRDKTSLAKEVVKLAHENAALKNRVHELEHELFWHTAAISTKDKP